MNRTLAMTCCVVIVAASQGCRGSLAESGGDMGGDTGVPGENNVAPGNNLVPGNNVVPGNNITPNNVASDMGDPGNPDVVEPPIDLGACGGAGFGEELTVAAVAGTMAQGRLYAAATSGGGAVLGWRGADGIHITHVDGAGGVVSDTAVDGAELYGLAAHDDGRAVMVSRGADVLALVILDGAHNPVSDQTIIGDVPHNVTDNEWFGPLIRHGAMTWTGSGWATYYPLQRLWNDGIEHYGDQLRVYTADGSSFSTQWGWGCSHSMDVKISHNGERLGPVCSSDCFPSKGVHFDHRGGMLWPDESGSNCAGGYGTSVGASVPIPGGFWVAFTAVDGRQSSDVGIARIDGASPGTPVWLTDDTVDDGPARAASFEADLVVAWQAGGTSQFQLVSGADGSSLAGPVSVPAADVGAASDFFTFANGDIGWVQPSGGSAGLARLRACR